MTAVQGCKTKQNPDTNITLIAGARSLSDSNAAFLLEILVRDLLFNIFSYLSVETLLRWRLFTFVLKWTEEFMTHKAPEDFCPL